MMAESSSYPSGGRNASRRRTRSSVLSILLSSAYSNLDIVHGVTDHRIPAIVQPARAGCLSPLLQGALVVQPGQSALEQPLPRVYELTCRPTFGDGGRIAFQGEVEPRIDETPGRHRDI